MDASADSSVLSDSLQRLQLTQESGADNVPSDRHQSGRTAILPDGYGFRPPSGISTPFTAISAPERDSPIPADPNGLGWPGMIVIRTRSFRSYSHRYS